MNQQESSRAEKAQLKHLELASRPGLRALIPDADALSTLEPAPQSTIDVPPPNSSGPNPEPLTAHEVSKDLGYDEYYSTMPLTELNSLIKAGERAVLLITHSSPEAAEALNILSYLLCTRYKITGKKQDIDKAIDLGEKAVASTASVAECFQVDLANILNNLGYSLQSRFHNFGALSDLHRSIEVGEQALAMAQTGSIAHVYSMQNLASRLYSRYQKTDEAADQERAIGLCKKALAGLAKEDPARSTILMTFSRFCSDRYRKIGFWLDIDEAIRLGRDALAAIPEDHHERGGYLHNLGVNYLERYNLSKNAKDLEEALPILRTAVEKSQNTAYCRDLCLDSYLRALEANFLRTGAVQDIREAINVLRKHISSMQTGVTLQTRKLQYGRMLSSKFKSTGDIADLIFLIHAVMEAMQADTDGKVLDRILEALSFLQHSLLRMVFVPTYNTVRDTMMKTLHAGYVKHSDKGFPEAIVEFLKGNDIIDFKFYLGPPERSGIKDPGIQQAIMEVVEIVDKARVKARSPSDPRPECRVIYSIPLNAAISADAVRSLFSAPREPIANPPASVQQEVDDLCEHTTVLLNQFKSNPTLGNLSRSIEASQDAISRIPNSHPKRATIIYDLCENLRQRFLKAGNREDLDSAVVLAENTLEILQNGHSLRRDLLHCLGMVLKSRYQHAGSANDLRNGIRAIVSAISTSGAEESWSNASMLNHLGLMLRLHYRHTGVLKVIVQAAEVTERAVKICRALGCGDIIGPMISNLGLIYQDKYDRTGDMNDLKQAICFAEQFAETHSHLDLNINLANALVMRYKKLRRASDIDKATLIGERVLSNSMQRDTIAGPGVLSDFSEILWYKYQQSDQLADLEKAIQHAVSAVNSASSENPMRADMLLLLGDMLEAKAQITDSEAERDRCISTFKEAWNCQTAAPAVRITAARKAVACLLKIKDWESACSILEGTVEFLPRFCPPWFRGEERQHFLSKLSGLAGDAAAAALNARRNPAHALSLLENARGFMMGTTINCRIDISHLEPTHPDVLRRFNMLRMEVDTAMSEMAALDVLDRGFTIGDHLDLALLGEPENFDEVLRMRASRQDPEKHRKVFERMDMLLESIRRLPGLNDFLLPPQGDALKKLAHAGSIVIVTCSEGVGRSDAIIVQPSGIRSVCLPKLSFSEATERLQGMRRDILQGTLKTFASRNKKMKDLLLWLWNVAVEQIIRSLNIGSSSTESLHHVRWIGVGVLSLAPFHAAGDHSPGCSKNAISHVISSYVSTVRALSYATEQKHNKYMNEKKDSKLLLVKMPETKDACSLPGVEAEAKDILKIVGRTFATTQLDTPTPNDVLKELPMHNLLHLACHGVSDDYNPLNSRLLLKSSNSWPRETAHWLPVRKLATHRSSNADLAFLSACSTAQNQVVSLADEFIHVANAFQLAGFKHVVGTLWQTKDAICSDVSREFYQALLMDEGAWEGSWPVGVALHRAVTAVRKHRPEMVLNWAAFVLGGG